MLRNSFISILFLCGAFNICVLAQDTPIENQSDQILESISDQTESSFDFDTYTETLNDLKENPLDLNAADYETMVNTGLFSDEQIMEIINYRKRMNGFATIYELQSLKSFDLSSISLIIPYITVRPMDYKYNTPLKKIFFRGKYQLFLRYTQTLEEQKGYTITDTTRSHYLGGPQRYYVRFRYNYSTKISYGFTAEKDPGEQFFKGTQKQGFDYYSGHLFLRDIWKFKTIAIGDYQIKWGQGLAIWSGFGFRKSPAVMNIQKNATGISQYTSVNEFNFLRGAAFTMLFNKLSFSGFASYKKQTANISLIDTIDAVALEVSSLNETGLHRTPGEIADKDAIKVAMFGGNARYRFKNAVTGINVIHTRFNTIITPGTELYRKFSFSGINVTNISVDYNFLIKNFNFFGETAINDKSGIATLNGLKVNEGSKFELAFLYRYFSKKYYSLYTNAFAESSSPSNESGLYTGMVIRPVKNWRIDTYFDFYKFPWLKYLVDGPSKCFDYYLQVNYSPTKNIQAYVRYQYQNKEGNVTANETKIDYLTDIKRQNIRFHIAYRINSKIELRNRFEMVWFDNNLISKETGYMIYQDIKLTPFKFPLTVYVRYALFDTKSYNSRIYTYENDILYSFSIPALYEKGFRYYLLLKYDITNNISIWLRFAQTQFNDRKTVGSGLDEIQGNRRSEIKAQIRFRF
jgi:hypothetical protein